MSQRDKNDIDPHIDLKVEEFCIKQFILEFGSQLNIMTRLTWKKSGRPGLSESCVYLRLVDQGLIETIGVWENVKTSIMGIKKTIDFKIIDP